MQEIKPTLLQPYRIAWKYKDENKINAREMDPSIWVETPFESAFPDYLRFSFLAPSTESWNQDGHAFRFCLEINVVLPFASGLEQPGSGLRLRPKSNNIHTLPQVPC